MYNNNLKLNVKNLLKCINTTKNKTLKVETTH